MVAVDQALLFLCHFWWYVICQRIPVGFTQGSGPALSVAVRYSCRACRRWVLSWLLPEFILCFLLLFDISVCFSLIRKKRIKQLTTYFIFLKTWEKWHISVFRHIAWLSIVYIATRSPQQVEFNNCHHSEFAGFSCVNLLRSTLTGRFHPRSAAFMAHGRCARRARDLRCCVALYPFDNAHQPVTFTPPPCLRQPPVSSVSLVGFFCCFCFNSTCKWDHLV